MKTRRNPQARKQKENRKFEINKKTTNLKTLRQWLRGGGGPAIFVFWGF